MSTTTTTATSSNTHTPLNILSIGGSRNIGYYAALKLLQTGATVTFLLRNPSIFDNDTSIQNFLSNGQACIVKGDALVKDDVARSWTEATKNGKSVDYLIFTLGGTPKFELLKGCTINPPNLVTNSLLNVLCTIPHNTQPPRILTISSTGLTPTSHSKLPVLLKPLYGYLLAGPHADKLGAERLLHHVTNGWEWNSTADGEPSSEILPSNWKTTDGLPAEGSLRSVVVIRPSMFTDGESVGDKYDADGQKKKAPYRVSTEKELGGYTISRKDVAHFVVELVLNRWNEFENKIVNISY